MTDNTDLMCIPISQEVMDGIGYGYDYNYDGDLEDDGDGDFYGYAYYDAGTLCEVSSDQSCLCTCAHPVHTGPAAHALTCLVCAQACSADDTTCEACTPAPGQCVVTPKCASSEPISTPRPPWICACQEQMWREHWDPAHIPTFVHVTVALDYAVGDFDKVRQGQMTSVIANAAGVEEEDWRVTISSVADGDASGSIAVGVRVRVPPFEAVPVADRADSIRGKLTLELINAQVALESDSLKAITAVLEAASIHSGETA